MQYIVTLEPNELNDLLELVDTKIEYLKEESEEYNERLWSMRYALENAQLAE